LWRFGRRWEGYIIIRGQGLVVIKRSLVKDNYLNNSALETNLRLKELLARRIKVRVLEINRRPSAVLIPIFYQMGQQHILFTRRTELVHYHKGEISFPGGGYHPEDGSLINTALRESFEEIGLEPQDVEVLGELDDVPTRNSNYVITPFVGFINPRNKYKPSEFEIAEIIEIPIEGLLVQGSFREVRAPDPGDNLDIPFVYAYAGNIITGATARILKQFLGLFTQVSRDKL
jgi:8-oxo-dGTP pyrophosphatase MutT (NUDIX family)